MKYYFNPPNKKPNFGTSLIKKWKNNCRMKRERETEIDKERETARKASAPYKNVSIPVLFIFSKLKRNLLRFSYFSFVQVFLSPFKV